MLLEEKLQKMMFSMSLCYKYAIQSKLILSPKGRQEL